MKCAFEMYATRSVETVSSEISAVVGKIFSINESLNIREIISDLLSRDKADLAMRASQLSELYRNASELTMEMSDLFAILNKLRCELSDLLQDEGITMEGHWQ